MAQTSELTWVPGPLRPYINGETIGGVLMILAALLAFIIANTPWGTAYHDLVNSYFGLQFEQWELKKPLHLWVNDFLMAIFFLMVGLEIKREVLIGELSNPKDAALSVFAAVGGMVFPALIFVAFNFGDAAALSGWGVPVATDIAFAVGILSLLGSSVPTTLKIFLTALAIVDDMGAVIIIALFYTANLQVGYLIYSFIALGLAALYGRLGGRKIPVYLLIGLFAWYFMFKSGVHATVAGVLLALTVPLMRLETAFQTEQQFRLLGEEGLVERGQEYRTIAAKIHHVHSPLHALEHSLHPLVIYFILPVFAFFNAGVTLGGEGSAMTWITLGCFFGLLVGKPLGIFLASWLSAKAGWSSIPAGVSWSQILGVGILGGIGFTMSFFIANLAFGAQAEFLDQAKLGVLLSSVAAAVIGLVFLRFFCRSVDEGAPEARKEL